jgi:hypothetical protein
LRHWGGANVDAAVQALHGLAPEDFTAAHKRPGQGRQRERDAAIGLTVKALP